MSPHSYSWYWWFISSPCCFCFNQRFMNFIDLKEIAFGFIDFSPLFFCSLFHWFLLLYLLFSSAYFLKNLLFFVKLLQRNLISYYRCPFFVGKINSKLKVFFKREGKFYKYYASIFINLNIFSNHPCDFFFDSWKLGIYIFWNSLGLSDLFLVWISSLILLWSENILSMISALLKLVLWPRIWSFG